MLTASLLLVLGLGGPPPADPIVERATAAYRAGRYAEACKLYQRAADAAPLDGERWADLGLCLGKQGKGRAAIAAERKAAALGDLETRLHAYYNLDRLGARLAPAPDRGCAPFASTAACPRALSVCAYTDPSASGTGVMVETAGLTFCPEGVDGEGFLPYPRSFAQLDCSSLELRSSTESKCRAGDVGGAECGMCDCDTAADPAACEQAVEACLQAGAHVEEQTCALVWIDACRNRAGAVCTGAGGKRTAVEVAPTPLPVPFDAFTAADLYRALHGEPPRTPAPHDDAATWLRQQRVVDGPGGKVLQTVTGSAGHGAVTATWRLDHGRLTLVSREEERSRPATP
jgi:hypothetical protein